MSPLQILLSCLLFVLTAVISAEAAGEYRTVDVESLKITIDSEWVQQGGPGYLPVRFEINNRGDARVIEIIARGNRWSRYGPGSGNVDIRRSIRLGRTDRVRFTIPVPVSAENENIRFQVVERGKILENFNYTVFQSSQPLESSGVLIAADASTPIGAAAPSWLRDSSGVVYPRTGTVAGGRSSKSDLILDPTRLPSEWLSFTSLRAVMIGPKEWGELSDAQRAALLTWTACGGDLIVVDGGTATLFPERPKHPWLSLDGSRERYFFGQIYFPQLKDVTNKGLAAVLSDAREAVPDPSWALPANRAPDFSQIVDRGFRLPIPGVNGVPARAYLWILLLFSLLIGPVNYVYLWRKGRQVLLVLTAPLLSLLFIVVLAGYAVIGEGFGVRGRAETFTILDQNAKQAATRARVSLYAAGMTPSGGLVFSRDVAVLPIAADGRSGQQSVSLDLTESQRFSAGLIEARTPSNFEEIAFHQARERLTIHRDGDRVSIGNGLGVAVLQLYYRESGSLYTMIGRIAPGETAELRRGSAPKFHQKFRSIVDHQPDGSYLAVLDRSPFWEPGISDVDERGSFHLVLGYVGSER